MEKQPENKSFAKLEKELDKFFGRGSKLRSQNNKTVDDLSAKLDQNVYDFTKIKGVKAFDFKQFISSLRGNKAVWAVALGAVATVFTGTIIALIAFGGGNLLDWLTALTTKPSMISINIKATETGDYGIKQNTSFVIEIADDVDEKTVGKAVTVEPDFDFSTEVEEGKIVIIPEEELKEDQVYKIKIEKGSRLSDNMRLSEDVVWTFVTEPSFEVLGLTPRDGSSAPADTAIEVEFSYNDVNIESFKENFTVTPFIDGEFRRVGGKIVLIPSNDLVVNAAYVVKISTGVKTDSGKTLDSDYSATFTVESEDSSASVSRFPVGSNCATYQYGASVTNVTNMQECIFNWSSSTANTTITARVYSATVEDVLNSMKAAKSSGLFVEMPRSDMALVWQKDIPKTGSSSEYKVAPALTNKGIYLLQLSTDFGDGVIVSHYEYIVITGTSAVLYGYDNETNKTLAYVVDSVTGMPVSSAEVALLNSNYEITQRVNTNENGIVDFGDSDDCMAVIVSRGDDVSIALSPADFYGYTGYCLGCDWNPGVSSDYQTHLVLDKPYYNFGDTIQFHGYIRGETEQLAIPADIDEIKVRVYTEANSGGSNYATDWALLGETVAEYRSDYGTFSGSYTIPTATKPALRIDFMYGDNQWLLSRYIYLMDESYTSDYNIMPSMQNGDRFENGETAKILIQVAEANGDPVLNDSVSVTVTSNRGALPYGYTSGEITRARSAYEDSDSYTTYVPIENGSGILEIPISCTDLCYYDVSMYIGDYSSGYINFSAKGTDRYVYAENKNTGSISVGDTLVADIHAITLWDGATPSNATNYSYVLERKWYVTEYRDEYNYETKTTEKVPYSILKTEIVSQGNGSVVTSGVAEFSYKTAAGGSFVLSLYYTDGSGKNIESKNSTTWYVNSSSTAEMYDNEIVVNMPSEIVRGETMTIDISGISKGVGKGLVVIGSSSGMQYELVEVNKDTQIQYGVPNGAIGTVCVDVAYLSGNWSIATSCTLVKVPDKQLSVTYTGLSEVYTPGETVTFKAQVKDNNGNPVDGILHVEMLDKRIDDMWATAEGSFNLYNDWYGWKRYYSVSIMTTGVYDMGGYGAGGDTGGVRSEFKDVAMWETDVEVVDGVANLEVTLPDNLTSWNIYSTALTNAAQTGNTVQTISVARDVQVRVKVPDYLHVGEVVNVPVTVSNYTSAAISKGFMEYAVEGACSTDTSSGEVTIGAQKSILTQIKLTATTDGGTCTVSASFKKGGEVLDGEQRDIPVLSDEFSISTTTPVSVEGGDSNEIKFNFIKDDYRGEAILSLGKYPLDQFNFDMSVRSTQQASAFIMWATSGSVDASESDLQEGMISALAVLRMNQSQEGCFGWFDYDACDREATAYAFVALSRAQDAGYEVDDVLDLSSTYLRSMMMDEDSEVKYRIIALWALSFETDNRALGLLNNMSGNYTAVEYAYLLQAANNYKSYSLGYGIVQKLMNIKKENGDTVYWIEEGSLTATKDNDRYVTAMILSGLEPYLDYTTEIENTHEKGLAYISLSSYVDFKNIKEFFIYDALNYGISSRNVEYRVLLNGTEVGEYDGFQVIRFSNDLLNDGENTLRIENTGDNRVAGLLSYLSRTGTISSDWTVTQEIYSLTSRKQLTGDIKLSADEVVLVRTVVKPTNDSGTVSFSQDVPSWFMTTDEMWYTSKYSKELDYYYKSFGVSPLSSMTKGYVMRGYLDEVYGFGSYNKMAVSGGQTGTDTVIFDAIYVCKQGVDSAKLGVTFVGLYGDSSVGTVTGGSNVSCKK